MITYTFTHTTTNTNININLLATFTSTKSLSIYENKHAFEKLCFEGCPNYNKKWSCPPLSPTFSQLSKNYSNALLLLLYCDLSQFEYIKTEYMKIKASSSILKSRSDKLMRLLESNLNGKLLSNGSCRLCKPCAYKLNKGPCKKPQQMRYSMEALGLDVGRISLDFFKHELLWYRNKTAPKYSSVVSSLLTNDTIDREKILDLIKKIDTI